MGTYGVATYGKDFYECTFPPSISDANIITIFGVTTDQLKISEIELSDEDIDIFYRATSAPTWDENTIVCADFDNSLEAGLLKLGGVQLMGYKVMAQVEGHSAVRVVGFVAKTDELYQSCHDAYAVFNRNVIYSVVTVDENGAEGDPISVTITLPTDGWWLVDPDDDSNFVEFLYNLEEPSVRTEEDRVEITTFGKYPIVRYGPKKSKRGSLSTLFIPDDISLQTAIEQVEKAEALLALHKPLVLKNNRGNVYLVDANSMQESMPIGRPFKSRISIEWVEIGEIIQ